MITVSRNSLFYRAIKKVYGRDFGSGGEFLFGILVALCVLAVSSLLSWLITLYLVARVFHQIDAAEFQLLDNKFQFWDEQLILAVVMIALVLGVRKLARSIEFAPRLVAGGNDTSISGEGDENS